MPVRPGARLGPYEIVAPLGAGGMGEVYRARDMRLGRDVAIKVLPADVATDADRRARFEREARAVAALSHPNILALFDIGTESDTLYVVTELLTGETLADRLRGGALPVRKAVEIAIAIARGLGAAHEKGIAHRDLKPANVFLLADGQVKILDFGLARETGHGAPGDTTTHSALTDPGTVLGTVGYMAPEQVRGRHVDGRADLFALGVVLYEMLTGQRAFARETTAETLTAILKDDPPDLAAARADLPPALARIVAHALEKSPSDRFQSARDVIFALEGLSGSTVQRDTGSVAPLRTRRPGAAAFLLAAGVAAGAIAGVVAMRQFAPMTLSVTPVRSVVELPLGKQLTRNTGQQGYNSNQGPVATQVALSPDGALMAVSAGGGGVAEAAAIHLRRLDSFEASAVAGTEGGQSPFFSPDGQWLGFWTRDGFKKWSVTNGGLPIRIAAWSSMFPPQGVTWGDDGTIVFADPASLVLRRIDTQGQIAPLTTLVAGQDAAHSLPSFLPGARVVLFTTKPHRWGVRSRVEALSLETGARTVLLEDAADARYVPSGHLLYMAKGVLMAVRFDSVSLTTARERVPLVQGVQQSLNTFASEMNSGAGQYAISGNGLLTYASGGSYRDPRTEVVWVDREGGKQTVAELDGLPVVAVRLSPDGRRLGYRTVGADAAVWVLDLEKKTRWRVTRDGRALNFAWSPDGRQIAVAWSDAGTPKVHVVPADGTASDAGQVPIDSDVELHPADWLPDARGLLLTGSADEKYDISLHRPGQPQPVPLFAERWNEHYPALSPDGRWLAYVSDESGRDEVYVTAMERPAKGPPLTTGGGVAPLWSPDGRTLYYWKGWSELHAMPVNAGADFTPGPSRRLFTLPTAAVSWARASDVSKDGRRFIIPRLGDPEVVEVTRLNLVQGLLTELQARVPAQR